jgi:membrane protein DedA with SNARE-associated domain
MGDEIKNRKWFRKTLSDRKMLIIQKYLHKYGILTFIICRFIPFGVRNMLFMSSGFSKMDYKLFAIYDLIAATISTTTLYFLIYYLGISVEKPLKMAGIILFVILIAILVTLFLNFFVFKKEKSDDSNSSEE